jgi:hypothetical protein
MNTSINWPLLREAIAIIDGIPSKHFDLNHILRNKDTQEVTSTCGTTGCAIGWLTKHPGFVKLGVSFSYTCGLEIDAADLHRINVRYQDVAEHLFGLHWSQSSMLFSPDGESCYDGEIPGHSSSKTLFRNRVRKFFEWHGQPISPKF